MVAISQSVWRFMKEVNMLQPNQKITALYCRLSRDDNVTAKPKDHGALLPSVPR